MNIVLADQPQWMKFGSCLKVDPDLFFSDVESDQVLAKKICSRCPVEESCFAFSLARKISDGVWGGHSAFERRQLLRKKSRRHCPGCDGTDIETERNGEVCVRCGLTWFA